MIVLDAKNIHKTYSGRQKPVEVLKGIDLQLNSGSFSAIMGPSGSGKSTLMHILAGLLAPDQGSVSISDNDITSMKDKELTLFRRRNIGIVYQDYSLIPTLTVAENITLPVTLDGKHVNDSKLQNILQLLGLSDRTSHRPSELSGGECQRVAIGRALITEPAVIFADEPTGNLDSIAGKSFCELLSKINKEQDATILMITHDCNVAAYAENIFILKDGVIVEKFKNEIVGNPKGINDKYLEVLGE